MVASEGEGERDPRQVEARPEKRFFIEMLVKDIELVPAVVDFVDNSVDSARELRPNGNFEDLKIEIEARPEKFSIEDNCAGISTDIARRYAFHFGRPRDFTGLADSVGQFGVGMKRALFKLGRGFRIESRTQSTYFLLEEDVRRWAAKESPDWSFQLSEFSDDYTLPEGETTGTRIEIDPLLPSVRDDFDNEETLARMKADLQVRHQQALRGGLEIILNGTELAGREPRLQNSQRFGPIRKRFQIAAPEQIDDLAFDELDPAPEGAPNTGARNGRVTVDLFAGIVRGRRDEPELDEGERILRDTEAGWYLFCNDRLLLVAEHSPLTGWGDGAAALHPQYFRFRGYVYLSGHSSLLPWNTTKTSVDRDSEIWRHVRGEMVDALRHVQRTLDRLKRERQTQAKGQRVLEAEVAQAQEVPLGDLPESDTMRLPELPRVEPTVKGISYSVETDRFERARETLDAGSASEVGRRTFDWYYERQVQE